MSSLMQTKTLRTQHEPCSIGSGWVCVGFVGLHVGCAEIRFGCTGLCIGSVRVFRYQWAHFPTDTECIAHGVHLFSMD